MIAESPPKQKEGGVPSFFYYDEDHIEDVALMFKETMTALFDPNWLETKWLDRKRIADSKRGLLRRFSRRGFYLLDALDEKPAEKTKKALRDARTKDMLKDKIEGLVSEPRSTQKDPFPARFLVSHFGRFVTALPHDRIDFPSL